MSEKTEQPTPKKIRKAREDGQVAHSKDFTQTVLFLALFGYMLMDAEGIVRRLSTMMVFPAGLLNLQFEQAVDTAVSMLLRESILLMLPFLLIVVLLGIFVEMAQTGMLFALKSLKPSGKKLNIINNAKNVFSKKNLVEFLKSNLKIVVLSAVVWWILSAEIGALLTLPGGGLEAVGVATGLLLKDLVIKVAVGYAIIAAADFVWQRQQYTKQLMMSKDEVKQEYKEAEGDPHIKGHRKHLHQELLQEGAVQRSREASVMVTNPTHLAVALLYIKGTTPLPVVLATGEGALAARMVDAATRAGVPVLQNIPLAWALKDTAQVGEYIPEDLIRPVAEVLRAVQALEPNRSDP